VTSGRTARTSSGVQAPTLPSSTNRPPSASERIPAGMKSLFRLFNTMSTPAPPVRSAISPAKSSVRELMTCRTPCERSSGHLCGLAVANTSAPTALARCTAAWPTPPAAEWISTRSPAFMPARVCSA
jgi:hypothetical protein